MCHWTLSSVNAITSYNTSDNSVHFHPSKEFWIWCPNRQKILQSLHIILKNKNRFDGSQKVENSCNYCNDHFKTKFVFIHHKMSQHVVNCNLAIIVSFTSNENHHVSGDVVQLLLPEGFESGVGVGFSFQWIWIWTWIKKFKWIWILFSMDLDLDLDSKIQMDLDLDLDSLFYGFGFGLGFKNSNGFGSGFGLSFQWIWIWTWIKKFWWIWIWIWIL